MSMRPPMASRMASVMASPKASGEESAMAWAWKSQLPYPLVPLFPYSLASSVVTLSIHRYGLYRAGVDKRMGRSAAFVGGGF